MKAWFVWRLPTLRFAKRNFLIAAVASLFSFTCLCGAAALEINPSRKIELPLELKCEAWALADERGNVIAGKNEEKPLDMAGCSRLMTALIAAEEAESGSIAANTLIPVSKEAARVGGTSAFLAANNEYAFADLFCAMLLAGANDAACAISEYVSGSEAAFVARMNARAAELSISPVFVNCTGHKAEGQSMNAAQAAKIGAQAAKHDSLLQSASRYTGVLTHASGRTTDLVNPNRLVKTYAGCGGLATGSSASAGYCGIYTATREGKSFIVCVAGAQNDALRQSCAKSIFDCAFSSLETVEAIKAGTGVARDMPVENGRQKTVHGVAGGSVSITIKKGEKITKELKLNSESLAAPVTANQRLGEVIILIDGKAAAAVPVIPQNAVAEARWVLYVQELAQSFMGYVP